MNENELDNQTKKIKKIIISRTEGFTGVKKSKSYTSKGAIRYLLKAGILNYMTLFHEIGEDISFCTVTICYGYFLRKTAYVYGLDLFNFMNIEDKRQIC